MVRSYLALTGQLPLTKILSDPIFLPSQYSRRPGLLFHGTFDGWTRSNLFLHRLCYTSWDGAFAGFTHIEH